MSIQMEIGYDKMNKMNDMLMDKVGCFAFLLPNRSMYWEYDVPVNPKQKFERICLALYVYYFDYGRSFLNYILTEIKNSNPSHDYLQHKAKIQTIRTRIAHGVFDNATENEMYLSAPLTVTNEIDWDLWVDQIVAESNSMLTNIELWAQNAGSHRKAFSDAVFDIRCINDHIVFYSIDKDARSSAQNSAKDVLKNIQRNPKRWLEDLNRDIKNGFLADVNYGPSDVVYTIYRELFNLHNGTRKSSLSMASNLLSSI